MTKQEKIAHLLRRFGLGASAAEMMFYDKLGVDGTIERLINYEKYTEGIELSPWAFSYTNQNQPIRQIRPQQVASWWALKMMITQRPLQEKLSLFWHDHFAVSGSKIGQGFMMVDYLQTIRKGANGNFKDLLVNISKSPAMIEWLDNDTNIRGKPNENFAREVMELFTVGIGHYSETDIQESARAFTGWQYGRAGDARRRPTAEDIETMIREDKPQVQYIFRPNLHDAGMKNFMGKSEYFSGEMVLDLLAAKKETATYVTSKMWEWFAYPKPEPKVKEKLAKAYLDSGYDIKKVLYAIAESDEFWSDKCARKQIKSPVDFSIATCRILGMGPALLANRAPDADMLEPMGPQVQGVLRSLETVLTNQGMQLLYPPDVAGWDWGIEWISSATMVERIKLADMLFIQTRQSPATSLLLGLIQSKNPQTSAAAVDAIISCFDGGIIAADRKKAIVAAFDRAGGVLALNGGRANVVFQSVCRVLFASPEYQFC